MIFEINLETELNNFKYSNQNKKYSVIIEIDRKF
jgi:hypothetical protein